MPQSYDLSTERLIPFSQAPKHRLLCQGRTPGKPISLMTLHRWRTRGIAGVVLETKVVGRLRFTSDEAIVRFFRRINGDEVDAPMPGKVDRQHAAAERELEAVGA